MADGQHGINFEKKSIPFTTNTNFQATYSYRVTHWWLVLLLQTFPFFGVVPELVTEEGKLIEGPGEGYLVSALRLQHSSSFSLKNLHEVGLERIGGHWNLLSFIILHLWYIALRRKNEKCKFLWFQDLVIIASLSTFILARQLSILYISYK